MSLILQGQMRIFIDSLVYAASIFVLFLHYQHIYSKLKLGQISDNRL